MRLILVFQISQLEIDFWQWKSMNVEEMKVRHRKRIYPPRIKMEVSMANTTQTLLRLCFQGCKSRNGRDLMVERILPIADATIPSLKGVYHN